LENRGGKKRKPATKGEGWLHFSAHHQEKKGKKGGGEKAADSRSREGGVIEEE